MRLFSLLALLVCVAGASLAGPAHAGGLLLQAGPSSSDPAPCTGRSPTKLAGASATLVLIVPHVARGSATPSGAVDPCQLSAASPAQPLYHRLPTEEVALSADGRLLVYQDAAYTLHLVHLAAFSDHVITRGVVPRFSHDGRYLAFITSATLPMPGAPEWLMVYDVTTGALTRIGLTDLPRAEGGFTGPVTLFAWSPRANTLVWPSRSGPTVNTSAVGGRAIVVRVLRPRGGISGEVVWSADGTGLLFWQCAGLTTRGGVQMPLCSLVRWPLPAGPARIIAGPLPIPLIEGRMPAPVSDARGSLFAGLAGSPTGGLDQIILYAPGLRPRAIALPGEPRVARFAPDGRTLVVVWTPPGIVSHATLITLPRGRLQDLGPAVNAYWIANPCTR